MSEMSQRKNPNNGVNGSGNLGEAAAPGRGPVATQDCPDRHQATAEEEEEESPLDERNEQSSDEMLFEK